MSFFDSSPLPVQPEGLHVLVTSDEPSDRIGGPLTLALLVGKSDRAAVIVRDAVAYTQGVSLTVETISPDAELLGAQFGLRERMSERSLPPEFMRLGVEYSDGTRATNLPFGIADYKPGAVFLRTSGHGGNGRVRWGYWLSPLPTKDPFTFACEWPHAGIELTLTPLDVTQLTEAASKSRDLWPE